MVATTLLVASHRLICRKKFSEGENACSFQPDAEGQQVRPLEDEYWVQLVIARGSQLSLTEDGQSLVEIVAPLVEGFDSLREMFADIAIAQGNEPLPQFHVWPLASYPVQLICPHNHTLAVAP